jgi:hypothetical protein
MVHQFRAGAFVVEINAFQELLAAELSRVAQEQRVLLAI